MIEARSAGQILPLKITDETILFDINNAIASLVEKLEKPVTCDDAEMVKNSLEILKNTRDYMIGRSFPVAEKEINVNDFTFPEAYKAASASARYFCSEVSRIMEGNKNESI